MYLWVIDDVSSVVRTFRKKNSIHHLLRNVHIDKQIKNICFTKIIVFFFKKPWKSFNKVNRFERITPILIEMGILIKPISRLEGIHIICWIGQFSSLLDWNLSKIFKVSFGEMFKTITIVQRVYLKCFFNAFG